MHRSDVYLTLWFTVVPLLFVGLAVLLGWWFRRVTLPPSLRLAHGRGARTSRIAERFGAMLTDGVVLAGDAATAREEAMRVTADVRRAHAGAWLAYATVMVWIFLAHTRLTFENNVRFAIAYGILAPQLLILLWEIGWSRRRRLFFFLLYVATGVALLHLVTAPASVRRIAVNVGIIVAVPMAGLLVLFIRRIQPFLILLIAAAVQFLGLGVLLVRYRYATTVPTPEAVLANPWAPVLGLLNIAGGAVVAWLLIRQRWPVRLIGVTAAVIGTVLLDRDLAQSHLPVAVRSVCFIAVTVLQFFVVWAFFKMFAWLMEHRLLTRELVQIHLCWAFLTVYFYASAMFPHAFYAHPAAVRSGVLLALALHALTLHALLFRVRRERPKRAKKRLLLLRAFGRPNEREGLLDDLNDTWRRIGTVDLLGASDVMSRTLESRMLEAFLLRRTDRQFVHSDAEIEARVGAHRSELEADARYAVNALYCRDEVWQNAFTRLAKDADVVLMDLRGFTTENKGCLLELQYLLQHEPPHPIVLLVDSRSDGEALEAMVRGKRNVSVLDFTQRSTDQRQALFDRLLSGAFPTARDVLAK